MGDPGEKPDHITDQPSADNSTPKQPGIGPLSPDELRLAHEARPHDPTPRTPEEILKAGVQRSITGDLTRKPSAPVLNKITRRVARWVGWKRCLICKTPFWSESVRHQVICQSPSCRNTSQD